MKNRTALVNQARGLLGECGIVMHKGIRVFRSELPEILDEQAGCIPEILRVMLLEMYDELLVLDRQIEAAHHTNNGKRNLICHSLVYPTVYTSQLYSKL